MRKGTQLAKLITVEGEIREISRPGGVLMDADEIRGILGGNFTISARSNVDGKQCYALTLITGWADQIQNVTASKMCGRMLFGPVLIAEVGNDIT